MGFRRYNAAISLSTVSTHSFFSFCLPSFHTRSCMKNNCVWRIISIFHGCMVWIENSVTRVTDWHHEACRDVLITVISSDGFFLSTSYTPPPPPHPPPPMKDTFSCIPFDLQHLIFKAKFAIQLYVYLLRVSTEVKRSRRCQ